MTSSEINAEIFRNMSILAEDENMLRRVAKYLRKLVSEKEDKTEFTKEEFLERVDNARKGPSKRFESVDELDKFIQRL